MPETCPFKKKKKKKVHNFDCKLLQHYKFIMVAGSWGKRWIGKVEFSKRKNDIWICRWNFEVEVVDERGNSWNVSVRTLKTWDENSGQVVDWTLVVIDQLGQHRKDP